jgi:hypothetical protein
MKARKPNPRRAGLVQRVANGESIAQVCREENNMNPTTLWWWCKVEGVQSQHSNHMGRTLKPLKHAKKEPVGMESWSQPARDSWNSFNDRCRGEKLEALKPDEETFKQHVIVTSLDAFLRPGHPYRKTHRPATETARHGFGHPR